MPQIQINTKDSIFHLIFRVGMGFVLTSATMLVIPRFISPYEMGQASLALSVYAFLLVTCEGGFRLYAIRTNIEQQPLLVGNLLINQTAHVALLLLLVAIAWAICLFLSATIWVQSLPLAFLMLLFQPLYFRRQMATVTLERELNFKVIGAIEIVENFLYNIVLLISAWHSLGAWSFFVAHAVRCLVGYIQSQRFPIIWPKLRGRKWLSSTIIDAYRYGFSLQGIQWVHNLRGIVTNSMIIYFTGASALGLYDRSLLVGNTVLGLFQGVSDRFFFAYISKHYGSDAVRCKQAISQSIRLVGWLDKLFYLGVLFVGLPVLLHFWGGKWQEIEHLVPIVVLGTGLFGSLTFPTYPLLTAMGKTGFMFKMALLAFGITLIAGPILLHFFGIAGACWLSVLLWILAFLWIVGAKEVIGPFKWFGSWLASGAIAIALYFFIKKSLTTF